MEYTEYKQLKDKIDTEYQKKIEALEIVWHMSQKDNFSHIHNGERSNTTLSDAIRKVVDALLGDFSANDIEEGIKIYNVKNASRLAITNTLHRLCRRGEINIVKKGAGRTPGTYCKAKKTEDRHEAGN